MARDRDLSRVCRTSKIFKSGFAQQVVLALGSSRGQVIAVAIVVGQSCMRLCGRDSFHIKCSSNLRRPLIFTAPPVTSNKKHSKNPLQTGQICPSRSRVCGLKIRGHKKRWPLTNGIGRFTEWDNVRDWYGLSYSRVETFFLLVSRKKASLNGRDANLRLREIIPFFLKFRYYCGRLKVVDRINLNPQKKNTNRKRWRKKSKPKLRHMPVRFGTKVNEVIHNRGWGLVCRGGYWTTAKKCSLGLMDVIKREPTGRRRHLVSQPDQSVQWQLYHMTTVIFISMSQSRSQSCAGGKNLELWRRGSGIESAKSVFLYNLL